MRAFLALPLSPALAQTLAETVEEMRARAPDARFVPAENIHLPVRFLGALEETSLPALEEALRGVAAAAKPFELEVRGTGSFGRPSRPRILFAGLAGSGLEALQALAQGITEALLPLGLPGFKTDLHLDTPHLTLARARAPPGDHDLCVLRKAFSELDLGGFAANELVLFQSEVSARTAKHVARLHLPFGG